jgi:hypothetical protein
MDSGEGVPDGMSCGIDVGSGGIVIGVAWVLDHREEPLCLKGGLVGQMLYELIRCGGGVGRDRRLIWLGR